MENNGLKKQKGGNATPDEKYTAGEKTISDSTEEKRVGEELIKLKDSQGEILQPGNIDEEKKASDAEKMKKKTSEGMEVLPNRSWLTNFYHNYIKEVESANETPKPIVKPQKPNVDINEIPIRQFEKFGITQQELLSSGMLEKLLKGEKTLPVHHLHFKNSKGELVPYSASFYLAKKPDGTTAVKMNYLPQKPFLQVYDKIQKFLVGLQMKNQPAQKESEPLTREPISGKEIFMLKKDRLQNKLLVVRKQEEKIPGEIKGVKLSQEEQQLLKQGKEVMLSGLKTKEGMSFFAGVKWSKEKNRLVFTNAFPQQLGKTLETVQVKNSLAKEEVKSVTLSPERQHTRQPKGIRR